MKSTWAFTKKGAHTGWTKRNILDGNWSEVYVCGEESNSDDNSSKNVHTEINHQRFPFDESLFHRPHKEVPALGEEVGDIPFARSDACMSSLSRNERKKRQKECTADGVVWFLKIVRMLLPNRKQLLWIEFFLIVSKNFARNDVEVKIGRIGKARTFEPNRIKVFQSSSR
jgi:hypothetical protein